LKVTSCGFRDLVAEGADQLLLSPLAYVGRPERVHRPMIALAVSDERADAHDGVVNVLGKFVAEGRTNIHLLFSNKVLAAANPPRSGTVSKSHTMTFGFIRNGVTTKVSGKPRRAGLARESSPDLFDERGQIRQSVLPEQVHAFVLLHI
jgi:hypothetical protein